MSDRASETDREVLNRIVAEPKVKAMREAAIRDNEKRKVEIREMLRTSKPVSESRNDG